MGIIGLQDSTISGLVLQYSPQWYRIVANSTNVIFDNINIAGGSKSSNIANTDGVGHIPQLRYYRKSSDFGALVPKFGGSWRFYGA